MEQVYTELNSFTPYSVDLTLTPSKWNQEYADFSITSVSQATKANTLTLTLDSAGTSTAGDILGQSFVAANDNINNIILYGKVDNVTDDLRVGIAFPSAYSASGTPTFDLSATGAIKSNRQ